MVKYHAILQDFVYNTMSESFGIGKKEQSIGYPDWGFIKCFRPGTVFRCYMISAEEIQFPPYIRLGKFMAKTKLDIIMAQEVQRRQEPISHKKAQLAIWKKFGTEIRGSTGSRKRYYLSDLESFRGGMESDFTVAIYDELDKQLGLKPLKTYNLPFVLRRTKYEELSKQHFVDLVKCNHPAQAEEWLTKLERQHKLLGYVHVSDLLRGKANEAYFEISESAVGNQYHRVLRLDDLTIDGGLGNWLLEKESINGRLKTRKLNCWISEQNSLRLNTILHLSPLFAVYPLHLILPNGKYHDGSIAFGLDAFLLDSIAKKIGWTRSRSDNAAIIL